MHKKILMSLPFQITVAYILINILAAYNRTLHPLAEVICEYAQKR